MVTLTGTFTRLDGDPATGTVKITPSRSPIMDPDGKIVISGPQVFPLDMDGKLTTEIPASDDPDLGPPFTYAIDVNLAHASWKISKVWIPHGSTTVDLSEIGDYTPTPGVATRVVTIPADGKDGQVLVWDGAGFSWADSNITQQLVEAAQIRDEQVAIAGLTGEDDAVAHLLNDPDTRTYRATSRLLGTYPPPPGFRLDTLPMPKIGTDSFGQIQAHLDLDALRPPEGATYYTAPTALSGNDGLTPETPLTISRILQDKPDAGTIILADGIYSRGWSQTALTGSGSVTRDLNWVAAPGANPILTSTERVQDLTWDHISGHIYATSRSATIQIFDIEHLNAAGDWTAYEARDTHAEIDGPGQWAIEGSTVHVWAIGDTDLTMSSDQIRLSVLSRAGIVATNSTHYVEGIEFVGMHHNSGNYIGGIIANVGSTIIAKNCAVRHNLTDGFQTLNGGHLIAVDCESSSNSADGFNYHDTQYRGGEFIEIDCHAHHNGQVEGAGTNNGTTSHEGVKGIRVGGVYEQSHGPVVADVNKAKTWNVDCSSGDSTTVHPSQSSAWRVDGTGHQDDPAIMWLEKCRAHDANTGLKATGGAQIRWRQTVIDGVAVDTEGDVAPFI